MTRSAPKLVLLLLEERPHQDIKKRSRHQDKTRRRHALLACLDLACSDGWLGSYAWIGSESSVQDSPKNTPRCNKSNIIQKKEFNTFNTYLCYIIINPYTWERKTLSNFLFKTFFKKFFSHLVFIFKFSISEAPNQLHGKMTLEAFFFQVSVGQHATVQQYQVFNAWMVP